MVRHGALGQLRVRPVLGFVILVIGGARSRVLLALWTHAALIGMPVIVGRDRAARRRSRWMPKRTAKGYAVLRRVDGFRRFIDESEKDRAQFAERKNLFSEYLPYAIVFGATKKWATHVRGPRRRATRHVVVVRVAARCSTTLIVLERDRQLHRDERRHAHVVAGVDVGLERIRLLRRRLLRRWRRRRWRRLLVAVDPR